MSDAVEEINHLAYTLKKDHGRVSWVVLLAEITHVFHRGSRKIPELWCSGAPKILSGDLGVDNGARRPSRRPSLQIG